MNKWSGSLLWEKRGRRERRVSCRKPRGVTSWILWKNYSVRRKSTATPPKYGGRPSHGWFESFNDFFLKTEWASWNISSIRYVYVIFLYTKKRIFPFFLIFQKWEAWFEHLYILNDSDHPCRIHSGPHTVCSGRPPLAVALLIRSTKKKKKRKLWKWYDCPCTQPRVLYP